MPRIWAFLAENSSSVRMPWRVELRELGQLLGRVGRGRRGGGGAGWLLRADCGCAAWRPGRRTSAAGGGNAAATALAVPTIAAVRMIGRPRRSIVASSRSRVVGCSEVSGGAGSARRRAPRRRLPWGCGWRRPARRRSRRRRRGTGGPHVLEQEDGGRRVRREVDAEVLDVFLGRASRWAPRRADGTPALSASSTLGELEGDDVAVGVLGDEDEVDHADHARSGRARPAPGRPRR